MSVVQASAIASFRTFDLHKMGPDPGDHKLSKVPSGNVRRKARVFEALARKRWTSKRREISRTRPGDGRPRSFPLPMILMFPIQMALVARPGVRGKAPRSPMGERSDQNGARGSGRALLPSDTSSWLLAREQARSSDQQWIESCPSRGPRQPQLPLSHWDTVFMQGRLKSGAICLHKFDLGALNLLRGCVWGGNVRPCDLRPSP